MQGRSFVAVLAVIALLSACTSHIDMSGVESERSRSLHRYDVVQALATNGEVVVGGSQGGAVIVSKDQGKSWVRTELGPVSIIGLSACPNGEFIGIDFNHKVWSADKGGGNWRSVALEKPRVPLALTCDGRNRWWVTGSGARIAVSQDRGATWTLTDLQEDAQLTTIQFVDDSHGFVLGEFGHVIGTEDGGATWRKLAQIPGEFYPYAALFRDGKEGWASGIAGHLLHTADGGRTWTETENRSGAPLYRLFWHAGQPYGVGAGGVVARLDNGVWQSMAYPDAVPVFLGAGASLGDAQAALVVGGPGGLVRPIATHGKESNGS
jgi:photosystem II stability/assembly factor-like uncharacterized protein